MDMMGSDERGGGEGHGCQYRKGREGGGRGTGKRVCVVSQPSMCVRVEANEVYR